MILNVLFLVGAIFLPSTRAADFCQELVQNGNFEQSPAFKHWEIRETQSCYIVLNNGVYDPEGPGDPTTPIEGNYDALTNQPGPGICQLRQTVPLPTSKSGIISATLSWKDRIRNYARVFVDPHQEGRVIVELDGPYGPPNEVWSTNPGDAFIQLGANSRSFDVTNIIKKEDDVTEMSINLVEQDNLDFFNINWDSVSLEVCSLDFACPCDQEWKNHGQYVSCVAKKAEELVQGGFITEEEKDSLVSERARSTCGKKKRFRN